LDQQSPTNNKEKALHNFFSAQQNNKTRSTGSTKVTNVSSNPNSVCGKAVVSIQKTSTHS